MIHRMLGSFLPAMAVLAFSIAAATASPGAQIAGFSELLSENSAVGELYATVENGKASSTSAPVSTASSAAAMRAIVGNRPHAWR
ncbi:MAG: hypothetical protein R2867_22095 [Caldilineaceae bacterium]